jgi:DNA-binding response OmpR family regulator
MRHPEVVLSKAEILDNVWDQAFDGSDNIVEVYIGYLRRKIDVAFGVTSLETVRGMGYRLMPVEGGEPVEDRAPATGGTARA